ncbi:hypothetical protein GOP47_0024751 [Adiantum capillus-veneris]|uniref:AAA+ ATPase domain-containing protein n=1 Tax=Adiantum capillus-veneris TaxID=13818 RepID=A0A9D4U503_ADICA|nr:hypothetical protein GOP47_0024751 [Adiantum capillus-veneris]
MIAASFHSDCHRSSPATPSFSYNLARRPRTSNLVRRQPQSDLSTLVCSNTGQFRLSLCHGSSYVQASANDNAEGSQQDDNDLQSEKDDKFESKGWQELLTSVKSALVSGTHRYMHRFHEELRTDAGQELEAIRKVYLARHSSDIFKQRTWPQFMSWNRLELWKDVRKWDAQRYVAILVYSLFVASCLRAVDIILFRPQRIRQLTNAYMEAIIPDPSPQNVKKVRKAKWRKRMPEGLKMQRFVYDENGEPIHDLSYVGENPWEESKEETTIPNVDDLIDKNPDLTVEQKAELRDMAAEIAEVENTRKETRAKMSWQERLQEWDKMLRLEDLKDYVLARNSDFVIKVNLDEVKKSLNKNKGKQNDHRPPIAHLVSNRWWQYRPKLPYLYFISKLRRFEVESAVYTSDTKRLYVRMKEGFPSEYIVDIPVDPCLHELMKSCEVDIDMIGRSEWSYYSRAFIVLAPSVLFLLQVKHFSNRAMEMTSERILDLLKMDREHLILPEDAAQKAKSEYKDVIVGDKIWKVLEEIMGYMREPMRYYSKGIVLPRGILISGPPGTGKTLLARAIARESGLPFVFASGAEFVESSTGNGAEKLFNLFFTARANAPSFIFIDEIDALAGKNVEEDPERRATFDQLITELDGMPENTSVDRFSKRQAVVLICATNRPQELHQSFLRPGRIDREIHIGLPGEKQRIRIFDVHSRNKRLAENVNFHKLVFRTVGYSGADIRNMVNEAGIMAARCKRNEICQQDFVDVLDKQLFEGMGLSLTDEEQIRAQKKVPLETRRLLAVHEAGHVLLAHLFPRYDCHALTHLLPGGKQTALSLFYPREEMLSKNYTTVGYLKMHLVVAQGGRCAERVIFGDNITDGGQDDIARISRIARELAISHASPRIGLYPMLWKDKFDPPLPPDEVDLIPKNWDRPGNRIANMTMELSEMFTREVTRYADEAEDEAMRALTMNRHILDKLASELLERIHINGLEIAEMIKSMNPIRLPDYMDPTVYRTSPLELTDEMKRASRFEELDIWQAPFPPS